MENVWIIQQSPLKDIERLSQDIGVSHVIAGILWRRNLRTLESAKAFFNPDFTQLKDPFLMKGMDVAVEEISKRIDEKRPILVYGDYDVDGTTAATTLVLYIRKIGGIADYYIPDRDKEGYGISHQGIEYAKIHGMDLIITCDCGITAIEQTDYAHSLNIDMIITDHHIPSDTLPAAKTILDPKQDGCLYPDKNLSGVGVAFKLTQALSLKYNRPKTEVFQNIDLVAVGTAADLVPTIGENRVFLHEGLKRLSEKGNIGLRAIAKVAGIKKEEFNTADIVFQIAPRINAVGRLGEATRAVKIMTSQNPIEAMELARVMNTENENRKVIESGIVEEAILAANAKYNPREKHGLVLAQENWHHGVIGIVASKLKERFMVPIVMIAINDGIGKASARSLEGFDMYEALSKCSDLLESFGGHVMAAGLTIKQENIPAFEARFLEICQNEINEELMRRKIKIEDDLNFSDIDRQLIQTLKRLAPFGVDNMRPIFSSRNLRPVGNPRIVGVHHLKFKVRQERVSIDAIGFNLAHHYENLISNKPIDLAYVISENEWQGKRTLQLEIKDIRMSQ